MTFRVLYFYNISFIASLATNFYSLGMLNSQKHAVVLRIEKQRLTPTHLSGCYPGHP